MKINFILFLSFFSYAINLIAQNNKIEFTPSEALESSFTTVIEGEKMLNVFAYDFNKDGKMDIAMDGGMKYPQSFEFNPSSNIIIMLGNGDGTFTQSNTFINYVSGGINNLIAASDFADYNKDGNVDMLVYSFWDNGFYLFDGNSNGFLTFDTPKFFSCSTHGYEAFFIDYDNDGDLDIVSACSGSHAPLKLHIFDNHNNQFTHASYGIDNRIGYSIHLKQGDVNGDGRMDFFMPIKGGYTVAIQNEDKSFTTFFDGKDWVIQLAPYKLLMDINHDGKDDLVAYKSYNNMQSFYSSGIDSLFDLDVVSNSSAQIKNIDSYYFYGGFMHAHDLDLDKNKDIVFVENDGSPTNSLVIAFDPFNTENNFEIKKIPLNAKCATETGRGMVFKDFDNNGLEDICFLGSDNKIRVVLNKATSTSVTNITNNTIKLYPNPTDGILYLDNSVVLNTIHNIKITNIANQEVYHVAKPTNHQINLYNLPAGVYIVYVQLENQLITQKIIVK